MELRIDGNFASASMQVSHSMKSDLYDAPRRSLRQLGLQPVEPGFPYYSPIKARNNTSRKSRGEDRSSVSLTSEPREERERSVRSESVMFIDEGNHSNHSGSSCSSRDVRNNGVCTDATTASSAVDSMKLANVGVRRQIIRPWEDQLLEKMEERMSGSDVTDLELNLENKNSNLVIRTNFNNKVLSRSVTGSSTNHRSHSRTSTPTREIQSLAKPADSCLLKSSEGTLVNGQSEEFNLVDGNVAVCNISGVKNCSSVSIKDHAGTCEQVVSPPQVNRRVAIDIARLLELYERVVREAEDINVEEMEKLHSTFEQLVFRHRMQWDKEALVEASGIL